MTGIFLSASIKHVACQTKGDQVEAQFDRRALLKHGLRGATGLALLSSTGVLAAACGSSTKSAASPTTVATAATSEATTAAPGPSLGSMAMQLSWINNIEFAGSFIAKQRGYYAQHGVDVNLLTGGPSIESIPLLVAGKALVATGGPDGVAAAINEGAPVTMIGACYQRNPFAITSLTSKPIHVPTDMYGKRIGVQAANQVIWKAFLKLAKLDSSKITQVPVQFDPTPLASGEVDGWFSYYTNEPNLLRAKGVNVSTMLLEDFGYHELDQVYVARNDSLSNPKELAQITAWMKGEILGWQDQLKDPTLGATLAVNVFGKGLGLDLAEQMLEAKSQSQLISSTTTEQKGIFWMADSDIARTCETLGVAGVACHPSYFTTSVLSSIYQGKASL